MPTKRSSTAADLQPVRTHRLSPKRNKHSSFSPARTGGAQRVLGESSSDASLLPDQSDGRISDSVTSDADSTSTLDGNADAEYEEDLEPEYSTTRWPAARFAGTRNKPEIDPELVMAYAKELEKKLHAFLPKLLKANKELAEQGAKANMEQVDESQQHIEMDLNLGVLEEKPANMRATAGDIQLPKSKTDEQDEEALQSTVKSVDQLLHGSSDRPKPSIELLDTANAAKSLPHRTGAINS